MASTITLDSGPAGRGVAGDKFIRRGVGNLGIYAAGGIAVTLSQLELAAQLSDIDIAPSSGVVYEWDRSKTSPKIKAFAPIKKLTATFDPASLAAVTSRDDAITVTGVVSTDVLVEAQAPAAILSSVLIQNARVTGTDQITVRLTNPSAGAVDVVSGTWTFILVSANGEMKEIPAAVDLSLYTFGFRAEGN